MKNKKTLLVSCAAAFLLCVSGVIRHDTNEKEYLELAQQKQFDCVGQVYIDTEPTGSCVLIRENFVLSAAHVFIESETRPDTMKMDGQTIVVFTPVNEKITDISKLSVVIKGQKMKVKSLTIHPHYLDSLTEGSCDIALIELEQAIKEIPPALLNKNHDELRYDVIGVGYGASGPADKPNLVNSFEKKIAGENVIDSIEGDTYNGLQTILVCDFDHPTRKDCNRIGSPTPKRLEYTCSGGDSGGGLFRIRNNRWELVGICSGTRFEIARLQKTGYYGELMMWTRVSAFASWIEQQIK